MPRNIRRKKPRDPSKPIDPARVIFEENRAIDEQRATYRHPDLQPLTLTALKDAFALNFIECTYTFDGQYECFVKANDISRTINPFDGADVLQFFRDVVCPKL